MPNDLKTQRNLLNSRPESRPESRSESQRQKLASSGFTASIWTLSGVVLVACSNVEDFLGIDDGGGGGGGRSVHVQNSPVQGARLYFDADGDGTVSPAERAAQDAQHPQGFVTNENGEATGIPGDLYGKAFVAVLDGAFDADTGAEFPANTEYQSIPNANGQHLLASPITDYVFDEYATANQMATDLTPEEVDAAIRAEVAELLGLDTTTDANQRAANEARVDALLDDVSDHTNYDGSSGVDALAQYLANNPTDVPTEAARVLGENRDAALDVTPPSAVTISAHDEFVATIETESLVHAVRYSIVASAGSDAFTVNERGVISVVEGATPTSMTLNVMVTNSDGASEMVSVAITVAASTPELDAPATTTATVAENVDGADLMITGIMADDNSISDSDFVIRAPGEFGDLSSKFDVVDGTGDTFDLVLKSDESLNFEEIRGRDNTINLEVWAVSSGVRSNTLEFAITVTDANDAPVFLPAPEDNDQNLVGDGGTVELSESARAGAEVARVRAADADASGPNSAVTYEISGGTGMALFAINNSGVITVLDASMIDYESGTTSYTLEITATDGGTPALADTMMLTVDLTDANDNAPMVTAPDGTIRTTAGNTADMNTGYSITVTDADTVGTLMVTSNDRRFTFERDDPNSDTWNLVLLAGEAVTAGTITLGYTATDGVNPTSDTITLMAVDTPVAFAAVDAGDLDIAENSDTWTVTVTATSEDSDSDGSDSAIASYEILEVRDAEGNVVQGNGVFSITNAGVISISGALNYEDSAFYTLNIQATDTPESGVSGHDEADTGTIPLVVRVQNVEEGEATYEIALTDENEATVTDLAVGVTLTPMVATDGDDPDGIDRVVSYLWSRGDGSSLNGDATGATYTLMAGDSTTATYSVTITYIDGTGKTEVVEASTSSVSFDTMPVHDAAMYPLTDGMATMDQYLVIPAAQITASGGDGKIEYSIDRDASSFGNAWFSVNPIDGSILVNEDRPAVWDYETVQTVELVIVATDVDDGSTMGTGDTARIPVTINITDANDAPVVNDALQVNTASGAIGFGSQENLLVRGDDITAMLGSGITPITGATAGDDSALDGTAADEYIYGDAGDDTITGGGGTDHIIGGAGDDGITLASGSVETIYYRFSTTGFAPIASDGADTVTGFRRGEDRIVLLDTDSTTPFDRDTLLSDAQNAVIGSSTFSANPLFDVAITEATVKLTGFQIVFDDTFFTINYATDSEVTVRSGGNWLAAAVPYLGALDNMGVPEDFASGAGLRDNSLLLNYFMPSADVLISEKRNAEDGFFATVSATDPDGTAPIMRYDITGGTGSALFTVDVMGRISVSDGVNVEGGSATLDYDATSEYTLEITATDPGGAVSTAKTITIGLINSESEYSLALAGTTLTATEDTADPDGVQTNTIMYRWFTTPDEGTTKNYIGAASGTNTYDTDTHTPPANEIYGVEVTYTDDSSNDETVDVLFDDTLLEWNFQNSARSNGITTATTHVISIGSQNLIDAASMTRISDASGTISYGITDITGTGAANLEVRSGKLYLKSGKTLTAGTYEIQVTATEDVTDTSITATITITVSAASPAIIPDRQAFAHQDPYEPNDDQNDQTNQDNPQTPPDIM